VHITSIIASRAGTFKNRELSLSHGASVIYGPNDSGKTLLSKALINLIFGSFDPNENDDAAFWNGFYLSASVSNNNRKYQFARNANTSLTLTEADTKLFSGVPPFEKLSTDAIADAGSERTAEIRRLLERYPREYFEQAGLLRSPLDESGPLGYKAFRGYLIDSNSIFSQSLEQIRISEGSSLFSRAFNVELMERESQIKQIDKELQLHDLQSTRTLKLDNEKREIEKDIGDLTKREAALEHAAERAYGVQYRMKEIELVDSESSMLETDLVRERNKIALFNAARDKLLELFPHFSKFTNTQKENLGRIQEIYRSIRENNEQIEQTICSIERISNRFHRRLLLISLICIPSSAAIFFASIPIPVMVRHFAPIGLLSLGLILSIASLIAYRITRKRVPVDEAREQKRKNEEQLKEVLSENQVSIDVFASEEAFEFLLQYFEEYGFYADQEDEALAIEQSLMDDEYFNECERKISELKEKKFSLERTVRDELRMLCAEFNFPKDTAVETIISHIENEKQSVLLSIEQSSEMLSQLVRELDTDESGTFEVRTLLDSRRACEDRLLSLYALDRTIRYAVSVMKETIDRRETENLTACANEALSLFNNLSGNQYVTTIDADSFKGLITGERPVPNTSITHMMNLCIKLALGSIMYREGLSVPLILDEPALYMDATRAKKCIEIVTAYAEKRQILVFTHDRNAFKGIDLIEL
jgi:DNA polymerase III delta prime subunit